MSRKFDAYQLALSFKREVYRLVNSNPSARRDYKYRDQLFEAASGIEGTMSEGFGRWGAAEFAQFIRYSLGSHSSLEPFRGKPRRPLERRGKKRPRRPSRPTRPLDDH